MSLLLDAEGREPVGYVATFGDATRELAEQARRDRLLTAATADLRRPAASLQAAAEMLTGPADLDSEGRAAFERILVDEATALSQRLERLEEDSRDLLAGAWPMSDVDSTTLFHCVAGKRPGGAGRRITGEPVWLHCDSLTIVDLLDHLIDRIERETGGGVVDLEARQGNGRVYLEIAWQGRVVPSAALDHWLQAPIDEDLGGITGRDVLDRHKTELWCEAGGDGGARLRLPLANAREAHVNGGERRTRLRERPEFYDFDLIGRIDPKAIDDAPLKSLTYVVFDTETTGLEPSAGDEIVSIAGVRVVNGRVLRGEVFDQLVDPGRPVPAASTKVHGITTAMLQGAPPIADVLRRFRRFTDDAVLVAHNAAFDMKFLTLKQEAAGVRFDNPVLDTVLLAARLHGTADSLTLDTLAARYGVTLDDEDRHTALGDSIATAQVLLRLLDLLEAENVRTLREAIAASSEMIAIRRRQASY